MCRERDEVLGPIREHHIAIVAGVTRVFESGMFDGFMRPDDADDLRLLRDDAQTIIDSCDEYIVPLDTWTEAIDRYARDMEVLYGMDIRPSGQ